MEQQIADTLDVGFLDDVIVEPMPVSTPATPEEPVEHRYVSKRIMDVAISGLGLIATLPVTLLTSAAIEIEALFDKNARGPLFYSQERVGRNGKPFRIYKFRTMSRETGVQEVDEKNYDIEERMLNKYENPRTTRVGRYLRKSGIDEIPQLMNVIEGDMSIVGPRPFSTRDAEELSKKGYRASYPCKPGITGPFQTKRNEYDNLDEAMKLNDSYPDGFSDIWYKQLGMDTGYVTRTAVFVLSGKHH